MYLFRHIAVDGKQNDTNTFYFAGEDGIIYGSVKQEKRTSDFRGSFLSFVSYVQFSFPEALLAGYRNVR